eukprot:scaffold22589_cov138-Cylindrotheca_fusiformis.AAC.9
MIGSAHFRQLVSTLSFSHRRKLSTSPSQTNIVFGANTDVGKSVIVAGLVRASGDDVAYVKPLQCGGSDEDFIRKHAPNASSTATLFNWETPASPHSAARVENKPVSDAQVLAALKRHLGSLNTSLTFVETAGGVLSPSSSSPENREPHHSLDKESSWGWVTQADLYRPMQESTSAILVGDGRLGGISFLTSRQSATLTALESLTTRGYDVNGVIIIEQGYDNQQAVKEYVSR